MLFQKVVVLQYNGRFFAQQLTYHPVIHIALFQLYPGKQCFLQQCCPVFTLVSHIGRASLSGTNATFTSVLSVSGVTPRRGSLNGGTLLTIAGKGFGANNTDNKVMLGNVSCEVTESTENEIKCRTPSGGRSATVDNSGSHPGNLVCTFYVYLCYIGYTNSN